MSPLHRWLALEADQLRTTRGARRNVVAPRGSAKTTWVSLAYPLREALEGTEPYIVLCADTSIQAERYLRTIRDELDLNESLWRDYPHAMGAGPIWRDNVIRLRNGVMIEALGTGAKIRGRKSRQYRPSLIIVDDPQNKDHIVSVLQRERSWEWLTKDVCNAGTPETNILSLGTALHRECIVLKLMQTPGWRSRLFKSVVEWPTRMDLWKEWEAVYCNPSREDRETAGRQFYEDRREEMDAGAIVLWPERESLYDLMCLRATVGVGAFGSEKQGSPINPDMCEWPEEYFEWDGFWFHEWPENLPTRVMALDPSKGSKDKTGDYSAFVLLGWDGKVMWVDADLDRRRTAEMQTDRTAKTIPGDALEHCRQWSPQAFLIETNDQGWVAREILREGEREKVRIPLYGIANTVNKEQRIRSLGPFFAQRRFRFRQSIGCRLLVDQLKDFPVGDFDDGPDALHMALTMLDKLLGQATSKGGPTVFRSA